MFTLATDTSCDALKGELDALNIPWVPLTFAIDGVTHEDDFTTDEQYFEFYKKVREGAMPITSQINTFVQEEFLQKLADNGHTEIVYLTLSSGLSATYHSACHAAKEVMNKNAGVKIYVVDTLGATQVNRVILDDAIKLRDEGVDGETAAKALFETAQRLQVFFVTDDLHHLKRGGRVSGVAAAVGTLLKIKPILTFNLAGELRVVAKVMGYRKALEFMANKLKEMNPDIDEVYMAQGDALNRVDELTDMIHKFNPGCKVHAGWCGPVIGAHTGSGILGLIFKSNVLREVMEQK